MAGWDDTMFSNLPPRRKAPPPRGLMNELFPVDPRQVVGGLYDQGARGVGRAIDTVTGQPTGEDFSSPTLGREAYQMLTSPTFGGGMSPMAGAATLAAGVPLARRAASGARTAEEIATGVRASDAADAAAQAARAAAATPGQAALDQMVQQSRSMADVPDIRRMPVAQGIAQARGDPHLMVGGQGSPGYYVGGPASVQSPEDLIRQRASLDAQIARGQAGADWYDRYRTGAARVTGNDPSFNDFLSQAHGTWSQGVNPESETAFVMKEIASRAAGQPERAMYENQHQAFLNAVEQNNPELMQTGKKTGEYAEHVNPNQPSYAPTATGVNDFRMAREMGFGLGDTEEGARGDETVATLGDAQHRYADYETANAAGRANQANLGGRSNWTGEQVQAAPWVVQKADALMKQRPNLSFEDAFAEANKTAPDFYPKQAVNITYEQQPARMLAETGHMPQAGAMTAQQKIDYANDARASFASAPSYGLQPGELPRDIIYGGQGARIGDSGMGYPTLPTLSGTGYFKNKLGEVEANPMFIARPLTGFNSAASLSSDISQTIKQAQAAKSDPATGPFALFHGDRVIPLGQQTSGKDVSAALQKAAPLDPSQPMSLTSNLKDVGEWQGFDPEGTTTIAGTPAGNKVMLPQSKDFFQTGEELRAYVLAQEGVGGHKVWRNPTPGAINGYFMPLDRNAEPEEMDALSQAGDKFGMPHVSSTAGGMLVTNFENPVTLTNAHRKAIPDALKAVAPDGAGPAEGVRVDPFYAGPAWGAEGSGTATDQLLGKLSGPSGGFFTNNSDIGRVAGGVAQRDLDYAGVAGNQRDDIWNARNIMAADPAYEGETWADRLAKYRKAGVPASVAVGGATVGLYPTAGLPAPLSQQQPGTSLNSMPDWALQQQDQRFYGY